MEILCSDKRVPSPCKHKQGLCRGIITHGAILRLRQLRLPVPTSKHKSFSGVIPANSDFYDITTRVIHFAALLVLWLQLNNITRHGYPTM